MIRVLDPVGKQTQGFQVLAPRPASLSGLKIGLLWNSKSNADIYLADFQKYVEDRFVDAQFEMYVKEGASVPPDEPTMAKLLECNAVVTAFGD
jgi:hypothetical protein